MFEDATKRLADVLYVGLGLSVIAFQKAQVQRHELSKALAQRFPPKR